MAENENTVEHEKGSGLNQYISSGKKWIIKLIFDRYYVSIQVVSRVGEIPLNGVFVQLNDEISGTTDAQGKFTPKDKFNNKNLNKLELSRNIRLNHA